jgi:hypothetical protein
MNLPVQAVKIIEISTQFTRTCINQDMLPVLKIKIHSEVLETKPREITRFTSHVRKKFYDSTFCTTDKMIMSLGQQF